MSHKMLLKLYWIRFGKLNIHYLRHFSSKVSTENVRNNIKDAEEEVGRGRRGTLVVLFKWRSTVLNLLQECWDVNIQKSSEGFASFTSSFYLSGLLCLVREKGWWIGRVPSSKTETDFSCSTKIIHVWIMCPMQSLSLVFRWNGSVIGSMTWPQANILSMLHIFLW